MFQVPDPMTLNGAIVTNAIHELAGSTPSTVIKAGTAFHFHVSWTIGGSAVPFLGGQWKVKVNYESLGTGPEGGSLQSVVPVVGGQTAYNTITPNLSLPEGTYKLITVITFENPAGTPRELAGFSEGPIIQVYDAV
ncbi:MAG: hypothetical protein ACKV2V_06655 [Blastocatellia bacterium]